jgi:RNA-directed DNA polymerase
MQDIFSFSNIYRAYLDCRKNKRNTINALRFEINAEENIIALERSLKNKSYRPSRSILFAAKKPKLREIFAADFKDRIVHHLLISHLEETWERVFIYDSYACRVNKGTHAATQRLQKFCRRMPSRSYFLQLDIKDFFTSINKEILFNLIEKKINDPDILWLTKTILFWDCTKSYVAKGSRSILSSVPFNKSLFGKDNARGLPIGNLTSQFFANIYMNELDQFVKHTLRARYYIRYVDDFVLLSQSREELLEWKEVIKNFLSTRLQLTLHPKRQKLQPISNGIDFLGYIIRPRYILVRRRVVNNFKAKIRLLKHSPNLMDSVASYLGHFRHANSYRLQQTMKDLYEF